MSHQGWSLLSALMEVKSIGQCRRNSKRLVWCSSSTLLDGAQIQLLHWWSSNPIGWSSFYWFVLMEHNWFIPSDRGQIWLVKSNWSTLVSLLAVRLHGQNISQLLPLNLRGKPLWLITGSSHRHTHNGVLQGTIVLNSYQLQVWTEEWEGARAREGVCRIWSDGGWCTREGKVAPRSSPSKQPT